MFPAVEHSELVTILRSHGGDLDATVDYLMALSLHTETEGAMSIIHQGLMQPEESYGQFSEEIGGLPSIISGDQTDLDSDDEAEGDAPVNHGGNEINEEALPSYKEATLSGEGESYVVAGCIMLPSGAGERQDTLMDRNGVAALKQPHSHKKHSEFLLSKATLCSLKCFLKYMHDGHKKHNHQYILAFQ